MAASRHMRCGVCPSALQAVCNLAALALAGAHRAASGPQSLLKPASSRGATLHGTPAPRTVDIYKEFFSSEGFQEAKKALGSSECFSRKLLEPDDWCHRAVPFYDILGGAE
eukprot:CAMPEP_0168356854 /NCGR_PEP_ID=MMETSP0228-20121227/276_1 /TAXON_ID=133427 /ORGANISM="Protoceratium reticulatum, Strain CCCM 535 (=CCMP 1889)" /LENGTH=110 /DNA_ID=CAMNT_0008369335 /DNA_START=21 /DNA_END=353 /DNA_ORIENTATION=-